MARRAYRGILPRVDENGRFEDNRFDGLWRGWSAGSSKKFEERMARIREPFKGITTDGKIVPNLFSLRPTGISTGSMVEAAKGFIASLAPEQRLKVVLEVDSPAWRLWTNSFADWETQGILLEDLTEAQRGHALALLAESFSASGFEEIRNVMKLNEAIGELIDFARDTLRQWIYFLTIFGEPSLEHPWGWQLFGHHLDLHCFVLGDQVVMTPTFMGAEFCEADDGPFAGTKVFTSERESALRFMHSLTTEQADEIVLYPSILAKDLPSDLNDMFQGRMRAGFATDNAAIPYEGLPAKVLVEEQRMLLLGLIDTYVGRMREGHRQVKMEEINKHLDETYVAWIGGTDEDDAFYYKIQSPVILVEYDCHPGVFLAIDDPAPFHAHTVVRTPNGNDYGKDLLRQHYAQFPH